MAPPSSMESLDKWVASGLMNPDQILERVSKRMEQYSCLDLDERVELRKNFDSLCTEEAGVKRISETAFVSFLASSNALPSSFMEAGHIIYRSVLYLSRVPFKQEPSEDMTFDELARGLVWIIPGRANSFYAEGSDCRGRTPADDRRMLFQSLAAARGGEQLQFDVHESRRLARRRAFDLPKSDSHRLEFAAVNSDEDGDEMYHDILDVLFSSQLIEVPGPLAPVPRDYFRPLAKKLHGNDLHLHHLTIPQAEFQTLVEHLVFTHFGANDEAKIEQPEDLDQVSRCMVKAFSQSPDVGVTWQLFDDALTKATPFLFDSLYRLLSGFFSSPDLGDDVATLLPNPGNILTFSILGQLGTILSGTVCFDRLRLLQHYKPNEDQINARALGDAISTAPDSVILLISGRASETGENSIFGFYIPFPSKDGVQIQDRELDHWDRCLMFELSPVHDVYRGKVGEPGWTLVGDDLSFGERENGVGLSLNNDLRRVIFTHNVAAQNKPIYETTAWRGNWHMEFDLEEIELWIEQ